MVRSAARPVRKKKVKLPFRRNVTPLDVPTILSWVDDYFERYGRYPRRKDGLVPAATVEDWINVDQALRQGLRSLPRGGSLAKLLRDHRVERHPRLPPPLKEEEIVEWAKAHHEKHGDWPTQNTGPVDGRPGEVWGNIDARLSGGGRGLPGGESLAKLFQRVLGVRNVAALPPLDPSEILLWADDHLTREGAWPTLSCGAVPAAPEEAWGRIDDALRQGYRGLPGGSSLARLLEEGRGRLRPQSLPDMTVEKIVAWARAHRESTGSWPSSHSGPVGDTGETWCGVVNALRDGKRGLPGGQTLARLLAELGCGGPGRMWTPEELEWLRTLPLEEVMKRTGRSRNSVKNHRNMLARKAEADV